MNPYSLEAAQRPRGSRAGRATIIILLLLLLFGARSIATYAVEYQWWVEMGQLDTWLSVLGYGLAPLAAATLLAFAALWIAHGRGLRFSHSGSSRNAIYGRVAGALLLVIAFAISAASLDTWTIVRFLGARGLPAAATTWRDAVFGQPLAFYLFDLPFYSSLRSYLLALAVACAVVYWLTARGWQLRHRIPEIAQSGQFDPTLLRLEGGLESRFLRGAAVMVLLALALRFFLGRYEMLSNDHGFMVGVDYVDRNIRLPLQWLVIAACLAAAALVWMGRWLVAASMAVA
ncbi:MAG: UPF0182 family protein, partial [Acidobacteria bacterium]|nr:UPF0182 family protein [Acidobacteriota bacterium]